MVLASDKEVSGLVTALLKYGSTHSTGIRNWIMLIFLHRLLGIFDNTC